ncbi:MAG TPA: heme-binding protein [Myxococcota bacterium]|nr:heme-binding protein [Myxococcota bacterium]
MLTASVLSLDMAKKMADAAETKALALGINIAIAIMDNHGNLKYFRRMDRNGFISVRMAPLKALTSASMPLSTKGLAARNETLTNLSYLGIPGIALLEGGLPIITHQGEHIGSIGVSGATPELDGICASCAVDAIKRDLAE